MNTMKNILRKMVITVLCFSFIAGALSMAGVSTTKAEAASKKKTLIVYYTTTGTTKKVANRIKKMTGGTLFRLQASKSYPSDYDELVKVAQKELDDNARPTMKKNVKNIRQYSNIILAYPIWWGDAPMVFNTFLEANNLSKKKIIPVCTSGGSGVGGSVSSLKSSAPKAKWGSGLTANDVSNKKLKQWLKKNKVVK